MSKLVTLVAILAAAALVVSITKGGISSPDGSIPSAAAGSPEELPGPVVKISAE